ncbi:unnamed protein product [Brassica oleracea var. botrytis]
MCFSPSCSSFLLVLLIFWFCLVLFLFRLVQASSVFFSKAPGISRSSDTMLQTAENCRSEKYSSIKAIQRAIEDAATLVNYKGKLASLMAQPNPLFINGTSTSFEMWILEDPEKHEWSSRIYKFPPVWKDVVAGEVLFFKGVTATNEIVLSPKTSSDLYYVYYYNFDKETIKRVEFQGMRPFRKGWGSGVFTLLNHVEDVKLM